MHRTIISYHRLGRPRDLVKEGAIRDAERHWSSRAIHVVPRELSVVSLPVLGGPLRVRPEITIDVRRSEGSTRTVTVQPFMGTIRIQDRLPHTRGQAARMRVDVHRTLITEVVGYNAGSRDKPLRHAGLVHRGSPLSLCTAKIL